MKIENWELKIYYPYQSMSKGFVLLQTISDNQAASSARTSLAETRNAVILKRL